MGQRKTASGITARASIGALALTLFLLAFSQAALAGPYHPRVHKLDITGLSHPCGVATDSKGDLYASSAGDSKVKVYNAAHTLLTEITDSNTPCGLAVTTEGTLYVSERATGEVVRFKPNAYPFAGTPTYGPREVIDSSTKAKGIAVDPTDNRLYVAEGTRVSTYDSAGNLGTNEVQTVSVTNATGGTFTLEFEGKKTAAIKFDASAAELKTALEALSTIGAGNVEVTQPSQFSVAFTGKLGHTNVPALAADGSGLTGSGKQKVSVSETVESFNGHIAEGALSEASGVAAYAYTSGLRTDHYLWVADADGIAKDSLYLFAGTEIKTLELRRQVDGAATPDASFGFGPAGAYLAADSGNRNSKGECKVGEQACTAGHLFLYDAEHKALDEFDASGEYLDRTANAAFADAEPTAIAIERSGGANDGTLYVTAGAGTGAKALAFGPLKAPSRAVLAEPPTGLSHTLKGAKAVATDSHGDVYAGALNDAEIHIYGSKGEAITTIGDELKPADIAVDSVGNVYVLDEGEKGISTEFEVTYYTPSQYPPKAGTTYERREEPIAVAVDFPSDILKGIAINPGPGEGKDHLFVTGFAATHEYDSAENESELLDEEFASCVPSLSQSIAVNGANGNVYFGVNTGAMGLIYVVDKAGKCLLRFEHSGSANGKIGGNPYLAVDQSNGHVIEYDQTKTAREYDAAGSFVAEFGNFTEGLGNLTFRVAVDSSCAIHTDAEGNPEPLDETTTPTCKAYDPANGTAYVAFDDTSGSHPPYDVTAFGVLDYGPTPPTPEYKLTVEKEGDGSGEVTSSPAGIECGGTCSAKFKEDVTVTLTAKADEKNEFLGFSGCEAETVSKTEGTCDVWMSEAREVKAGFKSEETEKFPLKVIFEGLGSGKVTSSPVGIECTSNCEAPFLKGVKVTLTATEGESSKFASWTGCDATSANKCEVSITGPREVKVKFKVETPLLKVIKKGAGSGTVSGGSPAEPNTINCGTGSGCEHEYTLGAEVTLKAKAEAGSAFGGWVVAGSPGACSGTGLTCVVTMSKAKEVTATFDTLPQAIAKQANPVLYDEATLRGEVDPSGLETEYRFQYLSEEEYEAGGDSFEGAPHTPEVELAPSEGFVAVEATLSGLEEGTAYRFRLQAMNAVGPAEDEGSFETLQRPAPQSCPNTAYRFGLSSNLPDCRAYELVTPAQTNGLIPHAENGGGTPSGEFSNWLTPQREEAAGERLSYFTNGTLPGFEGNGILDGYRAQRGVGPHPTDGWQSALFSPGYAESAPGIHHFALQHGIAPDQLYSIWEINPEPETFDETLPQGVYLQTPSGLEPLGQGSLGTDLEAPSRYVSPGGTHAIFVSTEHLEAQAAPQGTAAIYDRPAGKASAAVVSVKPDGSPFGAGQAATYAGTTEDGSAVAFSVGGALYLHRGDESTEIAAAPNTFAGISEDGQRVFYAASANGEAAAPLYACDVEEGNCAGPEQDQEPTEITAAGIFANVSPDGSHAFFSSTEALTGNEENDNGEEAEAGKHNLYAWDGTDTRFIGQLPTTDFAQNAFANIGGMNLAAWTRAISLTIGGQSGRPLAPTRSTPDGGAFAFQSHAQLTAYDNEGVGEIYRYEPAAEEGERLACVSCDPTGAPPSADALLEDLRGLTLNASTMIANLTDSGEEVFFQSFDRLLPEDANEAEDVYEWRAKGSGAPECKRQGGCLALISSGQGETPSFLYAMSADGDDVFLQTKEELVGADVPGSPSIYDARVGGGIPEPTPTAPCQGDSCQGNGTEVPAVPASETGGTAEGNATPPPPPPCAKGKHRVKGRCVAVKKHHKHHRRHRAHANRGGNR